MARLVSETNVSEAVVVLSSSEDEDDSKDNNQKNDYPDISKQNEYRGIPADFMRVIKTLRENLEEQDERRCNILGLMYRKASKKLTSSETFHSFIKSIMIEIEKNKSDRAQLLLVLTALCQTFAVGEIMWNPKTDRNVASISGQSNKDKLQPEALKQCNAVKALLFNEEELASSTATAGKVVLKCGRVARQAVTTKPSSELSKSKDKNEKRKGGRRSANVKKNKKEMISLSPSPSPPPPDPFITDLSSESNDILHGGVVISTKPHSPPKVPPATSNIICHGDFDIDLIDTEAEEAVDGDAVKSFLSKSEETSILSKKSKPSLMDIVSDLSKEKVTQDIFTKVKPLSPPESKDGEKSSPQATSKSLLMRSKKKGTVKSSSSASSPSASLASSASPPPSSTTIKTTASTIKTTAASTTKTTSASTIKTTASTTKTTSASTTKTTATTKVKEGEKTVPTKKKSVQKETREESEELKSPTKSSTPKHTKEAAKSSTAKPSKDLSWSSPESTFPISSPCSRRSQFIKAQERVKDSLKELDKVDVKEKDARCVPKEKDTVAKKAKEMNAVKVALVNLNEKKTKENNTVKAIRKLLAAQEKLPKAGAVASKKKKGVRGKDQQKVAGVKVSAGDSSDDEVMIISEKSATGLPVQRKSVMLGDQYRQHIECAAKLEKRVAEAKPIGAGTCIKVVIENQHLNAINLFWKDSLGNENFYEKVNAGKAYGIETFSNHPWLARDVDTGQLLDFIKDSKRDAVFEGLAFQCREQETYTDTVVIAPRQQTSPAVNATVPNASGDVVWPSAEGAAQLDNTGELDGASLLDMCMVYEIGPDGERLPSALVNNKNMKPPTPPRSVVSSREASPHSHLLRGTEGVSIVTPSKTYTTTLNTEAQVDQSSADKKRQDLSVFTERTSYLARGTEGISVVTPSKVYTTTVNAQGKSQLNIDLTSTNSDDDDDNHSNNEKSCNRSKRNLEKSSFSMVKGSVLDTSIDEISTEEPMAAEEPIVTEEPTIIDEPTDNEEATIIDEPTDTEEATIIDEPTDTEESTIIEETTITVGDQIIDESMLVEETTISGEQKKGVVTPAKLNDEVSMETGEAMETGPLSSNSKDAVTVISDSNSSNEGSDNDDGIVSEEDTAISLADGGEDEEVCNKEGVEEKRGSEDGKASCGDEVAIMSHSINEEGNSKGATKKLTGIVNTDTIHANLSIDISPATAIPDDLSPSLSPSSDKSDESLTKGDKKSKKKRIQDITNKLKLQKEKQDATLAETTSSQNESSTLHSWTKPATITSASARQTGINPPSARLPVTGIIKSPLARLPASVGITSPSARFSLSGSINSPSARFNALCNAPRAQLTVGRANTTTDNCEKTTGQEVILIGDSDEEGETLETETVTKQSDATKPLTSSNESTVDNKVAQVADKQSIPCKKSTAFTSNKKTPIVSKPSSTTPNKIAIVSKPSSSKTSNTPIVSKPSSTNTSKISIVSKPSSTKTSNTPILSKSSSAAPSKITIASKPSSSKTSNTSVPSKLSSTTTSKVAIVSKPSSTKTSSGSILSKPSSTKTSSGSILSKPSSTNTSKISILSKPKSINKVSAEDTTASAASKKTSYASELLTASVIEKESSSSTSILSKATNEKEQSSSTNVDDDNTAFQETEAPLKVTSKKARIRQLETILRRLECKINKFARQEVSYRDMTSDDSPYLQEARAKERYMETWRKYCKLTGEDPDAVVSARKKIKVTSSPFSQLNNAVQKYVNKSEIFPNLFEVKQVCTQANIKHGLHLKDNDLHNCAVDIFSEVGRKIQKRREKEFRNTSGNILTDEVKLVDDPAMKDDSLKQQLKQNKRIAKRRTEDVFKDFVRQQYEQANGEERSNDSDSEPTATDTHAKGKNRDSDENSDSDAHASDNDTPSTDTRNTDTQGSEENSEDTQVSEENSDDSDSDVSLEQLRKKNLIVNKNVKRSLVDKNAGKSAKKRRVDKTVISLTLSSSQDIAEESGNKQIDYQVTIGGSSSPKIKNISQSKSNTPAVLQKQQTQKQSLQSQSKTKLIKSNKQTSKAREVSTDSPQSATCIKEKVKIANDSKTCNDPSKRKRVSFSHGQCNVDASSPPTFQSQDSDSKKKKASGVFDKPFPVKKKARPSLIGDSAIVGDGEKKAPAAQYTALSAFRNSEKSKQSTPNHTDTIVLDDD